MTQRVLITAGASGIGLAIAETFAANGARVHIADVNADAVQQITQQNPVISGTVGDISKPADLDTLFRTWRLDLAVWTCSSTMRVSPAPPPRWPSIRSTPGTP